MDFGLDPKIVSKIIDIFRRHTMVEEVVLYGSRAKGNFRPGSDIDLTLKGEKLNLQELNRISLALDDLLLPYTFDLSIFDRISDRDLLDHIKRVGKTIYTKDSSQSEAFSW